MSSGYTNEQSQTLGGVLVTGGGSGIGRATALALADCGFDVTIASIEKSVPPSAGVRYMQADITDIAGHADLVSRIERPVCLVNCAGVTSLVRGDLMDLLPDSFDHVMDVNVRATFFLTQAFAKHMIASGPADAYRSIIFIGSINSVIVGDTRADYCMSKAAVTMMSKLFAVRLAEHGISTHEIRPGVIRTPITAPATERYDRLIDQGGIPARRWGEPNDIAGATSALAFGKFPYATGTVIDIAGGLQIHRV